MKFKTIKSLSLLLLFFAIAQIFPQEQSIRIIVATDTLPDDSNVYITGNTDELGNWDFMQLMEKTNGNQWYFDFAATLGDTLQFKFTRGSWRTEAVDSNGLEYPNFSLVVRNDSSYFYHLPGWRDLVQQKVIISRERMDNKAGAIDLWEGWKYKIGDDSIWATVKFDDSKWKTITPTLPAEEFKRLEWTGNIWFRNHIIVDSSLWNQPLGLIFSSTGAAEIYLDGKLIYKYGEVGKSKESELTFIDKTPKHIIFNKTENHLFAVRYSNYSASEIIKYDVPAGFYAVIGDLNMLVTNRIESVRHLSIIQMAFGAFIIAFSIMHLLLFIFYPKAKENLFYSISMLSFAVVIYSGIQGEFINSITSAIDLSIINVISVETAILFGLLTVYASTYVKMPKISIIFVVIWAVFLVLAIFFPLLGGDVGEFAFYIYALTLTIEIFRVVIRSLKRKESWGWGWIIGIGFIVAFIFIAYQILIILDIVRPLFGIYIVYVYGIVFLAITVSINLSKKVADTNKDLETQLVQVKELSAKAIEQERKVKEEELARRLLEADNKRKTKELEEARKLQLSMLPMNVPNVPNLDIAVYMQPATEVGGDYYDFKYNQNGSLTIAVGDATGHGMKAGTMVATIKGLFSAENAEMDITSFLDKSNLIIREMHLGNLFMAMIVTKIENRQVVISSAGMPPSLIYRQENNSVEEIRLQALPLGGSAEFKYKKRNTSLNSGDTLLLMSDGFPELFNEKKEILDYDNAKNIFKSVAKLSSQQIIEHLCKEVDNWRGNANLEDDITFVVVKVK